MKVVVIDPYTQSVYFDELEQDPNAFGRYLRAGQACLVGTSSNGDYVFARRGLVSESFNLDGRHAYGYGIVVGPQDEAGFRRDAKSSPERLRPFVKFNKSSEWWYEVAAQEESPEVASCVQALGSERARYVPVVATDPTLDPFRSFDNVNLWTKRYGGRRVAGWQISERPRMWLKAHLLFAWMSDDGEIIDVTPHIYHDDRVLFSPEPRYASVDEEHYIEHFFKLYKSPNVNGGRDRLEKAIDRFCATCDEICRLQVNFPEIEDEIALRMRQLGLRKLKQCGEALVQAERMLRKNPDETSESVARPEGIRL